MRVRDLYLKEIASLERKQQSHRDALKEIERRYPKLLEIECEEHGRSRLMGPFWICIQGDSSRPGLAARVATALDASAQRTKFGLMLTEFRFRSSGVYVDVEYPSKGCKKAIVKTISRETTLEFCGDLPDGYELIEYIEEPSDEGQ